MKGLSLGVAASGFEKVGEVVQAVGNVGMAERQH